MYMLDMLGRGFAGFNFPGLSSFEGKAGGASSFLMGFVFALAFCPVSAALYFGGIIPLAARNSAPFSLPLLYGLGTALPVIGTAVALDLGLKRLSVAAGLAGKFEHYARPVTGWVFAAAGVYLGLRDIFRII